MTTVPFQTNQANQAAKDEFFESKTVSSLLDFSTSLLTTSAEVALNRINDSLLRTQNVQDLLQY